MQRPFSENHQHRRVAITAMGIVSPLGIGLSSTLATLRSGRDCVSEINSFDTSKCRSKTAGQVPFPKLEGKGRRPHPASLMMMKVTREVVDSDPHFHPELMVVGTTSGGMSFGEQFYRSQVLKKRDLRQAHWLANYSPQKAIADAMVIGGFSVPSQIIANACASGTNAVGHAFRLVRAGKYKRVLCGGYDAISELVYVGFDSLQASTQDKVRPFDKNRSGLVLGEGAALLAIEDWEMAKARKAHIIAEIVGYGISTDNHHLTQPHPSGIGPELAMKRGLDDAGVQPADIDYINAHGTATTFNDASEGKAIEHLFGCKVPVSSTKSMMGHSLGAAGAIESVFSALAIQHQFLPPNINYVQPDDAWNLNIVANQSRPARVRKAVSNSFGFGGTNASVVFQEVEQ